ncbi:MAG: hypothetical protein K0S31_1510 [Sphingobacterium multivorum]|nr:hypothetical protein [Sphingobacterium multivorum]
MQGLHQVTPKINDNDLARKFRLKQGLFVHINDAEVFWKRCTADDLLKLRCYMRNK